MRKPVGKRLLPPATVGALPLDSTANKARGAVWRSRWSEGLGATGDAKERPCSEHRVGKPLVGLDAGPERSGTAVPEGCRHNRSEEPDALARTSGSGRGPSGNRRATATKSAHMKTKPVACLREPCAVGREASGEASVAVPAGGAMEHRKIVGSECRVCHLGRRQHQPHRKTGEGRLGSAVSKNPCTQVRLLSGPERSSLCPGGRPGPRWEGENRSHRCTQ